MSDIISKPSTKEEKESKSFISEVLEGVLGGVGAVAAGPVGVGMAKAQGADLAPERKRDLEDIKFP